MQGASGSGVSSDGVLMQGAAGSYVSPDGGLTQGAAGKVACYERSMGAHIQHDHDFTFATSESCFSCDTMFDADIHGVGGSSLATSLTRRDERPLAAHLQREPRHQEAADDWRTGNCDEDFERWRAELLRGGGPNLIGSDLWGPQSKGVSDIAHTPTSANLDNVCAEATDHTDPEDATDISGERRASE